MCVYCVNVCLYQYIDEADENAGEGEMVPYSGSCYTIKAENSDGSPYQVHILTLTEFLLTEQITKINLM